MKVTGLLFICLVVVLASGKHHKVKPHLSTLEPKAHHIAKAHHKNVHHLEESFSGEDAVDAFGTVARLPLNEIMKNAYEYMRSVIAMALAVRGITKSLHANSKGYYDYGPPARLFDHATLAPHFKEKVDQLGLTPQAVDSLLGDLDPFTSSFYVRHPKGHIPKEWRSREVTGPLNYILTTSLLSGVILDAIQMHEACQVYQTVLNYHDGTFKHVIGAMEFNRMTLEQKHFAQRLISWLDVPFANMDTNAGGDTYAHAITDFGTALETAGLPLNRNPFREMGSSELMRDETGQVILSPARLDAWAMALARPGQRATRAVMPLVEYVGALEKKIRDRDTKLILPAAVGSDFEMVVKYARRLCLAGKLFAFRVDQRDPNKTYAELIEAGQNTCWEKDGFAPLIMPDGSTDK